MTLGEIPQRNVLDFLASPVAHGDLPVKRIDTHAASVFLSGSRALKVKRAVVFPFLDYSTLDLRKRACLAEIEVNRPFAPDLYVGIARITKEPDGTLKVGGEGEVVEWAVEMRRFDGALTLDRYCVEHEITADMARAIIERLISVHKSAQPRDADGWIEALGGFLAEHHQVFSRRQEIFDPTRVEALFAKSQKLLAQNATLIRSRASAGLLVRGHGDLHLGNVALVKGEPVIFDAVEFDPVIASGDVLYDLAFLLMDMVVHGQRAAANVALNSYIQLSARKENVEGLILLPLFLSVRSSIRAVVAAARFEQSKKKGDRAIAQQYFEAAVNFLSPTAPRLIAIGGLSGTGKSHLARMLAPHICPEPGALILRSDVMRKALFGVSEYVRLGAAGYTNEANHTVYYSLFADAWKALAAGHSVILDAVFSSEVERLAAERVAREAAVSFDGLFLETSTETRLQRVESRLNDASDADRAVVLAQAQRSVGDVGWKQINANGEENETLCAALASLRISPNRAGGAAAHSANVSPMISA